MRKFSCCAQAALPDEVETFFFREQVTTRTCQLLNCSSLSITLLLYKIPPKTDIALQFDNRSFINKHVIVILHKHRIIFRKLRQPDNLHSVARFMRSSDLMLHWHNLAFVAEHFSLRSSMFTRKPFPQLIYRIYVSLLTIKTFSSTRFD